MFLLAVVVVAAVVVLHGAGGCSVLLSCSGIAGGNLGL